MSRAKTVNISKEKVIDALKNKNMLQKELAANIGMNYQALNRALGRGKTSERMLNEINRELGLNFRVELLICELSDLLDELSYDQKERIMKVILEHDKTMEVKE